MVLDEETKKQLENIFKEALEREVEIGFIEDPRVNKEPTEIGRELLKELESISGGKIKVNFYTKDDKPEFCEREEACGPIIFFEKYPNVRDYGLPSGEEFPAFIDDIIQVSHGHPHLPPKALEYVEKIDKPIKILVFITPTCPYCPLAVAAAHKMAMANKNIIGAMVEAYEYPQWADAFRVSAVPKNVILDENNNELYEWEGAMGEADFARVVYEVFKDKLGQK